MGITAGQFEQMKRRLAAPRRVAAPVVESSFGKREAAGQQVILGIDPSVRGTGYGVIRAHRSETGYVSAGTITCPRTWERSRCLKRIAEEIRTIIKRSAPTVCVIEGVFYAQNMQTAIAMGEARGAALATVAETGLEVYEIATRKVKQAIVGYGAAQKLAVAKMVQRMLRLEKEPEPDAADALALALTYAQERSRIGLGLPRRI